MNIDEELKKAVSRHQPETASKEDLLIQFINLQKEYYSDMRDIAYQHAKMAADLINIMNTTNNIVDNKTYPQQEPDEEFDSDLLGGEIGDNEPTRSEEG